MNGEMMRNVAWHLIIFSTKIIFSKNFWRLSCFADSRVSVVRGRGNARLISQLSQLHLVTSTHSTMRSFSRISNSICRSQSMLILFDWIIFFILCFFLILFLFCFVFFHLFFSIYSLFVYRYALKHRGTKDALSSKHTVESSLF